MREGLPAESIPDQILENYKLNDFPRLFSHLLVDLFFCCEILWVCKRQSPPHCEHVPARP